MRNIEGSRCTSYIHRVTRGAPGCAYLHFSSSVKSNKCRSGWRMKNHQICIRASWQRRVFSVRVNRLRWHVLLPERWTGRGAGNTWPRTKMEQQRWISLEDESSSVGFITVTIGMCGGAREGAGVGTGASCGGGGGVLPEEGLVHLTKQMASRGRNMMWKYWGNILGLQPGSRRSAVKASWTKPIEGQQKIKEPDLNRTHVDRCKRLRTDV